MVPWKMPPPIKIYEAIGAIGDRRVRALYTSDGASRWEVVSSDGAKAYTVEISADGREISSNDNASYWQGYLGYPGIAALLACGRLQASAASSQALSGIPWRKLNQSFKNDYGRTLDEVARVVTERGGEIGAVRTDVRGILEALETLALIRGVRRRPARQSS
jgi:hypothetical protein